MRWRALLVVLPCVLLPLPLVGLVFMTLWQPATPTHRETNLIPVLTEDIRRALMTYGRVCNTDADCDPPLGCLFVKSELNFYCTDSTCMEDKDCPGGFACLPIKTRSGKALVRRCSLIGDRKEGERCDVLARTIRLGCARGLLCQAGWCGRSCQLDAPLSCPAGFSCSEGSDGPPSCLPTCEGRPCPDGQQCLPHGKGASICRQLLGPDCRKNPCPKDQVCRISSPPQRPWEMRTECRQECDMKTPCPEGTVCLRYECRKTCDPQNPSTCGPGLICGQYSPWDPWYCLPG